MTEGKDYRFKSLINYAKELKEKKIEFGKSSKSNKNKFNRISVANYTISSIAVGSATRGIVTAVTIIGLPVTIAASAVSGALGLTSIILTSLKKIYQQEYIKEKELYTMLCKAITDIDILIGVGLDKNVQEISEDEFKAGKRIFNDAIEKIGAPSPDPK